MLKNINNMMLMSGAEYFGDDFAINPYMDASVAVDIELAKKEHAEVRQAFEAAGIEIIKVHAPPSCQDGVYTANWGLVRGNKVILSSLPNKRRAEQPYAEATIKNLGKEIIKAPYNFSGQGDALPCGDLLFVGSHYRTDPRMHQFLAHELGYKVIGLQTIPKLDSHNQPLINPVTSWPDSFFYDLDLALAVIKTDLIAWCPEAFLPQSRAKIQALNINKIEVSLDEAQQGFACNLVSTGETVIMSSKAPKLQAQLHTRGLNIVTPNVSELGKGGGYIRCVSLTLDN